MAIFSESSFCELQACTVQADTMVRLKCPLDKCPLSLLHVFSIQSLHLRHRTLVVHLVWKWVFLFATGAQVNCRSIAGLLSCVYKTRSILTCLTALFLPHSTWELQCLSLIQELTADVLSRLCTPQFSHWCTSTHPIRFLSEARLKEGKFSLLISRDFVFNFLCLNPFRDGFLSWPFANPNNTSFWWKVGGSIFTSKSKNPTSLQDAHLPSVPHVLLMVHTLGITYTD